MTSIIQSGDGKETNHACVMINDATRSNVFVLTLVSCIYGNAMLYKTHTPCRETFGYQIMLFVSIIITVQTDDVVKRPMQSKPDA